MSSAHTSGGSASGGAAAAATGGPGSPQGLPGAATPPPHSVIQTRVTTSQAGGPVTTTATPVPVPARTPAMHTTPGPPAAAADVALNGTTTNNNNNAAAAGQPTSVRPPPVNNGQQQPAVVSLGAIRTEPPKPVAQHQGPSPAAGPRTVGPAPGPGGTRPPTPQLLAPRLPQTPPPGPPNVQNFQLPPGMVLVRSESGQLLMIHQQALAQMQAQAAAAPRPATPTATPPAQAPGLPMGSRHMAPGSMVRQGSPGVATSVPPTTALHRPPVLQSSGGSALPGIAPRTGPQTTGTTVTSGPISNETMENVKKCRNFLSTLIKLASTGKQSAETADNVKELVKQLLEGKLEAEDFTSKLYSELNSSPQPYLVPFLKRSLPALRQLTPNAAVFAQQSHIPPQPAASTPPPAKPLPSAATVVLGSPGPRITTVVARPQIQPGISRPGPTNQMLLQAQPQAAVMRPQVTMATTPVVTPRNQTPGQIILGPPAAQAAEYRTAVLPVSKPVPPATLSPAQKNKLKEAVATFKDDDDINDVASMAGVNLTEENARILATNSELVGAVTRSCKDEAFLSTTMLQKRMVEIGKRFGVTELGIDVVTYVSHATQQRLQNLLEKVSHVVQHKNFGFKEESSFEAVGDVRAQLRFFEQLDQLEKQRKDGQERQILLKAAKSRARQEDPEQLRLKQKAKEMQQQELAMMRQKEANLTALAAIGPRKKRKLLDTSASAGASEGSGSGSSLSGHAGGSSGSRPARQRITRINLRDLLFCLETERFTAGSHFLYKGFLK